MRILDARVGLGDGGGGGLELGRGAAGQDEELGSSGRDVLGEKGAEAGGEGAGYEDGFAGDCGVEVVDEGGGGG